MNDPKRLLDPEGDGTAEERGLVEAARGQGVPAAVKAAIWTTVAAQAAGVATSAAAATGSAAKGGALAALWSWKGIAVLAVVGAGAATSAKLLRPSSAPSVEVVPVAAPVAAPPVPGENAQPTALAPPSPAAVAEPAPPAPARPREPSRPARPSSITLEAPAPLPASRLAEEAQSLVEARRLLRAGATAAALSSLAAANREFAGGRLGQEREALFIEALAQDGQTDLARQRAAVFLRSYPGSPHAADVKRHVEGK